MSHIQAMETWFKSFRFRSRLEARWAMFYDRINVSWEFEPQPLLVNGEAYLPDFYIKDGSNKFYHEVKSAHELNRIKPLYVYLAGKMGCEHNWRGENYYKHEGESWFHAEATMASVPFVMVGPFAASAIDHGCIEDFEEKPHWTDADNELILQRCKWAINSCDLFCVHISTLDAFGTLMEIGYAAARDKPISLTIDSRIFNKVQRQTLDHGGAPGNHDLWFAQELSSHFAIVDNFEQAQEHHASVMKSMTTREYRLIAGMGRSTPAVMTFGDPLDVAKGNHELVYKGASLTGLCISYMEIAEQVRAHRFDRR